MTKRLNRFIVNLTLREVRLLEDLSDKSLGPYTLEHKKEEVESFNKRIKGIRKSLEVKREQRVEAARKKYVSKLDRLYPE